MTLDQVLINAQRSDAIGRDSWYMETHHYMPRLRRGEGGFVRRNKDLETGELSLSSYTFTDEDRLATDWNIVQGNEPPSTQEYIDERG